MDRAIFGSIIKAIAIDQIWRKAVSEFVDNHPLARDLPEYRDSIHALKIDDRRFSLQMEKYEALDKEIVRVEQGVEHMPDLELDALKMQRVQLKDDLVDMLKKHRAEAG